MKFEVKYGLPFVEVIFTHRGIEKRVSNVLIDTGSAATLLSAEVALDLGLEPESTDVIRTMRGIGGAEFVYEKIIDCLQVDDAAARHFMIQIGAMDYGMDMNGILGTDFLLSVGMIIDMRKRELYVSRS
jgi:predicted aspartyl protease